MSVAKFGRNQHLFRISIGEGKRLNVQIEESFVPVDDDQVKLALQTGNQLPRFGLPWMPRNTCWNDIEMSSSTNFTLMPASLKRCSL